ncbi:MAG TPA: PQQ-dependent sugar dehydrogenase [Thermoanaerobaculia bacterium]|jgi:glucose/arabinose dehydrogenase
MNPFRSFLLILFAAASIQAATLPGFRVETLARADGFVSSLVSDSKGTIYFSTTNGWIHRIDGTGSTKVASLPTRSGGNGGLLGMALLDDDTAVVHYTTWNGGTGEMARVLDDVISRVDLRNGAETVLRAFACDIQNRSRGASSEHHGGNLTVAPDGSIFVGIGDYGDYIIAQKPEWNAGKIWRIDLQGNATQWARGMRNPYDLAWDPDRNAVVVSDNGPEGGDELHVVREGENGGWPHTWGNQPPLAGAVAPAFVFENTVAPTGLQRLSGANSMLRRGFLSGAFVTRALYYFTPELTEPFPVVEGFDEFIIDVTETPAGEIYIATAMGPTSGIHRLEVPRRGDCNGDGLTDSGDYTSLSLELGDGGRHDVVRAQEGEYPGSWGCDANADGMIDEDDLSALRRIVMPRRRSVRSR